MLAVIFDSLESSFQEVMKESIKRKFPSIEFEIFNRASIVAESPPETIILVMNEEALSDGFIELVKTRYPQLKYFICLVSSEKYEEYYSRYSSECEIIKKNKKDIRMWFESINEEAEELDSKEVLSIDDLDDDIDLEDLKFVTEEEETSLELDGKLDEGSLDELSSTDLELPDLDIPDIEDLLVEGPKEEVAKKEDVSDSVELNDKEQKLEKDLSESDLSEEDLSIPMDDDLLVDNSEEGEELASVSEEVPVTENQKTETTEKPIQTKKEVQITPEELKKINEQKLKEKYEEKIINLREGLDIPVWKKRQIQSKTIGIWSPLHRIGVTTLTINLALYLASLSIPVAVLEGITKNLKMKSLLQIYSNQKRKWISYNAYLEEEQHKATDTIWSYKEVNFFPFEERDLASKWNEQKIYYFMNGLKFHDIVFVDFPTGEMAPYTLESLQYVDELWIVMNDDLLSMMEWKEYIHQTVKPKVSVHGFFLNSYSFNKPKKLVEQMDLHFISSLPALHEEVSRNYYEAVPLFEHEGVMEKVEKDLLVVLEHLTGEKQKKIISTEKENGILNRFTKRLKRW